MLYKETPFLRYSISMASGIALATLKPLNSIIPLLFISVCIVLIAYYYSLQKRHSLVFGISIHLFLFIFGYSNLLISKNAQLTLNNEPVSFSAVLDDYPQEKANSRMISLRILSLGEEMNLPGKNRMIVYIKKDNPLKDKAPGTIISSTLKPIEIVDYNKKDSFDYQKYMNRKGYRYYAFLNDNVIINGQKKTLRYSSLKIRQKLLGKLTRSIDNAEVEAVVAALTLGYKNLLDPEVKEDFQRSGIIHILAVSGLHVGIISYISLLVFSFFKGRLKLFQIISTLIIIWAYALLSGLSPSVLRASLMFSFLCTGKFINRAIIPLNSVLASAFIILLINPFLLFDPSFLLSYSAVIYIISFFRDLYPKLNFDSILLDYFWKITVVSILAQLGTLPFVIMFFNKVPVLGLFSNLIAIPLAFIILVSGIILLISSGVPLLSKIFSSAVIEAGEFLISISGYMSSFDFAVINTKQISIISLILLLICIFSISVFFLKKNKIHPHIVLIILILYLLSPLL